MRRFLISLSAVAAAVAVSLSAPSARASSDGDAELALAVVTIGAFDLVSLPIDIYWGVKGEKVDPAWAIAEMALGGAQVVGGGIGMGVCAADPKCFHGVEFPLLTALTAWTSAMVIHGAITYSPTPTPPKSGPVLQRAASISFAPMIGDGRTTPAGIGFVGTF